MVVLAALPCRGQLHHRFTYSQTCDASAGVPLTEKLFAVASDEDNWLRIYDRTAGGDPVQTFNVAPLLGVGNDDETDIEGATTIARTSYWIGSHGADKHGETAPSRRLLFALRLEVSDRTLSCSLVGRPYDKLVDDLIQAQGLKKYDFEAASTRPPKDRDALNIEGLAAFEDQLLVGFRNPIPGQKALIVPITNPHAVLAENGGRPARAKLGDPIELDLGGRGIRSIEYSPQQKVFWIVAGAFDEGRDFALYRWPGPGASPAKMKIDFGKLHPEGLVLWPNRPRDLQILSDDSERTLEDIDASVPCKRLPFEDRQFRSGWISIDE